jgi:hypothetical protein
LRKVAVLASGFLHGAPASAKNFRACVLDPLNADLYVFTSRENVTREEGGSKHTSWLTASEQHKVVQAWQPFLKKLRFTEDDPSYFTSLSAELTHYDLVLRDDFRPNSPPEYVTHEYRMSCIDQYLRLAYCWDMLDKDYDVVIRIRPDLVFERPLEIGTVEENVLYVPCKRAFHDEHHSRNYLKEFMFWGTKSVMERVCSEWVYAYGIPRPLFDCGGSDYTLCPEHQFYLYARSLELQAQFVPLTCRYSEKHRAYEVVADEAYPGEDRVQL